MANHNEAPQMGFLSAKEPVVPNSVRSQKVRVNNENAQNKQEFAALYSRSLRKQTPTAHNNTAVDNPRKPRSAKPEQTHPVKQQSVHAANRRNQNEANTAQSGRNLPQNIGDGTLRQNNGEDHVATYENHNVPEDGNSEAYENKNHIFDNGFVESNSNASDVGHYAIPGQAITLGDQTSVSGSFELNQNVLESTITAPGIENSGGITSTNTILQPGNVQRQLLNPNTYHGQTGQPLSATSGRSALTSVSAETLTTSPALTTTNDKLLSPVDERAETLDPLKNTKSGTLDGTSSTITREALLRSIAEESALRPPFSDAGRLKNELGKLNVSLTDVYSNLNAGHNGQAIDVDAQQPLKQESTLFKDRLFAMAQQNSGQVTNATSNDINKLLLQQSAQLSTNIEDLTSNDLNMNGTKEPIVANRLSGSSLQFLSPMLHMSSTLGHKNWSNEVGQRVLWMVNTELQQAQLQLNPKHLGPIEIKISISADQQVNVNFLAHSATVKEALDQALPRLREVFDQSGLHLNDVNVQQESHKQHRDHHHTTGDGSVEQSHLAENMHEDVPVAQIFQSQSLSSNIVDFYA
ncbi:flagellar hook-length control protein FliK [Kaarinaea lacus]